MISDAEILEVVDRFVDVEISRGLNSDAGFREDHPLYNLSEYLGKKPAGYGQQNPAGVMLGQVGYIFSEPTDPATVWACEASRLVADLNANYQAALVAWCILKRAPDSSNGRAFHTDDRIAEKLGVSRSTFIKNLKAGKCWMANFMRLRLCK